MSNGLINNKKNKNKVIRLLEDLRQYKDDYYICVDYDNIHIETLNLPTKKAKKKIDS